MPRISGTIFDSAGTPLAGRVVRAYRRSDGALVGAVTTADGTADSSIKALLYFNGVADSTAIVDETGKTFTATLTTLSRAASIDGGTSLYCPNIAGSGVATPDSSDWAFGTGDFHIKLYINISALPTSVFDSPIGNWASNTGWCFFVQPGGVLSFFTDSTSLAAPSGTIVENTWALIEASRVSGTLRLFKDGALVATAANTVDLTQTRTLNIGGNAVPGDAFFGYIGPTMVRKGAAGPTTAYTPDGKPFVNLPASSAVGTYAISVPGGETYMITALAADATRNSQISDWVTPV